MSLDSKKIKLVHPKGNQPWIFIGRTDAETEAPILWPPDAKNWLIGKDPDAGKDWGQKEKRMTKDEMVGWHHRLNGHEFAQAPGDNEEQGSLLHCSPCGHKELDMTEWLNWILSKQFLPNTAIIKTFRWLKSLCCTSPPTPKQENKAKLKNNPFGFISRPFQNLTSFFPSLFSAWIFFFPVRLEILFFYFWNFVLDFLSYLH